MKRVLIVDDSAVFRKFLAEELNRYPDIEVVATASDPYVARDKLVRLDPDIVTVDVDMPRMDGISFLRKVMRYYPKPVIVLSADTSRESLRGLEAMEAGAVDVMVKPADSGAIGQFLQQMVRAIRQASDIRLANLGKGRLNLSDLEKMMDIPALEMKNPHKWLLVMGASTGGTEALKYIMKRMPADSPPVLIVQHMASHFTRFFAGRLNTISAMEVQEAGNGDLVEPGRAFIAPGNHHLILGSENGRLKTMLRQGPLVNQHRPSVDVLFKSVARIPDLNVISILLTGMGKDGAVGMLDLKRAGSLTIAQSERTCAVFGMPGAAIRIGAVDYTEDLENIPARIFKILLGEARQQVITK